MSKQSENTRAEQTKDVKKRASFSAFRNALGHLSEGDVVTLNFFKAHAWQLLTFLVIILALMGLRYKTRTKMVEINKLTVELKRSESSKLQEKALYMSTIRESEMKELVREKNLNLQFQEQPPYELSDDGEKN